MSEPTPIDNPLEWQSEIDRADLGLNLRGSARFWLTVAELTGLRIWRDGAPEFHNMVIELREGLGLLLSAHPWGPERDGDEWHVIAEIKPRFVELDYTNGYWPVKGGDISDIAGSDCIASVEHEVVKRDDEE